MVTMVTIPNFRDVGPKLNKVKSEELFRKDTHGAEFINALFDALFRG